ncbi:MAG: radical SAM protein [Thermodesulfobacteriota bacterium]
MKNRRASSQAGYLRKLLRGRIPGQLVIQITDLCNAKCPQCGMRATNPFERTRLSSDQVKRLIDAAASQGFKAISFTGGEPLLFLNQLVDYIRHARSAGLEFIRTGTNGFMFARPEKPGFRDRVKRAVDKLADTPLRNFWISIDSAVPGVHEAMRGFPSLIRGLEYALPMFHAAGLYPSANLGINRNIAGSGTEAIPEVTSKNADKELERFYHRVKEAFARFYRFVLDLGFTMVNTCYPMSIEENGPLEAVYEATSRDMIVRFSEVEKAVLFKALLETLPLFRPKIRIFTPRVSLLALQRQYSRQVEDAYPCRGGLDFFFVDSRSGGTFPCGYRCPDNLGKLWDLDIDRIPRADCRRCDWECFRDPSEMFGPILPGLIHPLDLLRRFLRDPEYFRLWKEDWRYYRACDWFNGRKAPDYGKLGRFESSRTASFRVE